MQASAKAAFSKGCQDWYAREGNVKCTQTNGRSDLEHLYKEWKPDANQRRDTAEYFKF